MEGVIVEAEVVSGNRLGRKLGFPTANMDISAREDITNGVYRSMVTIDGVEYNAMSNVGIRPSVVSTGRWLETHIFDFAGNLYGRVLKVRLVEKIRNERKFSSVAELRAQLEHDMEYCKMEIENMKKSVVSSFDVDHRTLREGLYLRSTYQIDQNVSILSWDLRFCAPMDRKPLEAGVVHTIEHLMAYHLRLDEQIGAAIVSFCPMGCQTGFYLSTTNSVTAADIAAALTRVYNKVFPIASTEDIVGLNEIQCGNPYLYSVEGTNEAMKNYINVLSLCEF